MSSRIFLNDRPKVLHVIVGLNIGGAELMLYRLIKNSPNYDHSIISLTDLGKIGVKLQRMKIKIYPLGLRKGFFLFQLFKVFRLYSLCRGIKPEIVQTWMYHADILGGLVAKLSGIDNIVWNVRNNSIPQGKFTLTSFIIKLCSLFSYFIPRKIVCVGDSVLSSHLFHGYDKSKLFIIENGYEFLPRSYFPNEKKDSLVLGIIGRFDKLKGFDIFFETMEKYFRICKKQPKVIMAGRGISSSNIEFSSLFANYDLPIECFDFLGEVEDVAIIYSKINLLVSSSISEGFPNVVVEAMSFGIPCLVTNVGESSSIVGDFGWVVPPNDSFRLLQELSLIEKYSFDELGMIGEKARSRVYEKYSISIIVEKYERLYEVLLHNN
jgi:glycosyltransferase involved in cell wall biosynthesis